MIVTCPSCSARYKINESKVPGRGAKITCQKCAHRFVFYRDGGDESRAADPVASLDFRAVGLQWRVKSNNIALEFTTLGTLQSWLAEGKVSPQDPISFNNRKWTPINEIKDISSFFAEVHRKASRGEISLYDERFGEDSEDDEEQEDDSDAPTTIVGRGSALATEIQDLVRDLATPGPSTRRVRREATTEPPSDPSEDEPAHVMEDDGGTPLYALKGSNSGPPGPSPTAPLPPNPLRMPAERMPAECMPADGMPAPISAAPMSRGSSPAAQNSSQPPHPASAAVAVGRTGQPGEAALPAARVTGAPPMAAWVVGGLVLVALVGAGLWFGGVFAP